MTTPTPADHLAWAICTTARTEQPCRVPCVMCRVAAAAVLRAAVEQVVSTPPGVDHVALSYDDWAAWNCQRLVRDRLLALATKLLEVPNV